MIHQIGILGLWRGQVSLQPRSLALTPRILADLAWSSSAKSPFLWGVKTIPKWSVFFGGFPHGFQRNIWRIWFIWSWTILNMCVVTWWFASPHRTQVGTLKKDGLSNLASKCRVAFSLWGCPLLPSQRSHHTKISGLVCLGSFETEIFSQLQRQLARCGERVELTRWG